MIKHGEEIWRRDFIVNGRAYELNGYAAPHECSVPNCPGDLNRRKLEMWDEMLALLRTCSTEMNSRGLDWSPLRELVESSITKARELK